MNVRAPVMSIPGLLPVGRRSVCGGHDGNQSGSGPCRPISLRHRQVKSLQGWLKGVSRINCAATLMLWQPQTIRAPWNGEADPVHQRLRIRVQAAHLLPLPLPWAGGFPCRAHSAQSCLDTARSQHGP
jgi:hypothetical protein